MTLKKINQGSFELEIDFIYFVFEWLKVVGVVGFPSVFHLSLRKLMKQPLPQSPCRSTPTVEIAIVNVSDSVKALRLEVMHQFRIVKASCLVTVMMQLYIIIRLWRL